MYFLSTFIFHIWLSYVYDTIISFAFIIFCDDLKFYWKIIEIDAEFNVGDLFKF